LLANQCIFYRNAWSKSGDRAAAGRCEVILDRMEDLFIQGRHELQPDATSFNTCMDAMAKSHERGSERRAEDLLERMDELSNRYDELRETCKPDQMVSRRMTKC
jgi:hypothetical protein